MRDQSKRKKECSRWSLVVFHRTPAVNLTGPSAVHAHPGFNSWWKDKSSSVALSLFCFPKKTVVAYLTSWPQVAQNRKYHTNNTFCLRSFTFFKNLVIKGNQHATKIKFVYYMFNVDKGLMTERDREGKSLPLFAHPLHFRVKVKGKVRHEKQTFAVLCIFAAQCSTIVDV